MKHKAQITKHIGNYLFKTLKTIKELNELKEALFEDRQVKVFSNEVKRIVSKKTGIIFKEKEKPVCNPYIAPEERESLREAYLQDLIQIKEEEKKEKRATVLATIFVVALSLIAFKVIIGGIIAALNSHL